MSSSLTAWDVSALVLSSLLFCFCIVLLLCRHEIFCAYSKSRRTSCTLAIWMYITGGIFITFHIVPIYVTDAVYTGNSHGVGLGLPNTTIIKCFCSSGTAFVFMASFYHIGFLLLYGSLFVKLHRSTFSDNQVGRERYRFVWLCFLVFAALVFYAGLWYYAYSQTDAAASSRHAVIAYEFFTLSVESLVFLLGIYHTLHSSVKERLFISIRWCMLLSLLVTIAIVIVRVVVQGCSRDRSAFLSSVQVCTYVMLVLVPALGNREILPCTRIQDMVSSYSPLERDSQSIRLSQRNRSERQDLEPLPKHPDTPLTHVYY